MVQGLQELLNPQTSDSSCSTPVHSSPGLGSVQGSGTAHWAGRRLTRVTPCQLTAALRTASGIHKCAEEELTGGFGPLNLHPYRQMHKEYSESIKKTRSPDTHNTDGPSGRTVHRDIESEHQRAHPGDKALTAVTLGVGADTEGPSQTLECCTLTVMCTVFTRCANM